MSDNADPQSMMGFQLQPCKVAATLLPLDESKAFPQIDYCCWYKPGGRYLAVSPQNVLFWLETPEGPAGPW